MTIWKAVLLGLVQGLCEFLPVSSSGHLILLQRMLGVESGAVFFTVMLHVATLVAVLIVYRRMVWQLLCHPFQKTVLYLILALVAAGVVLAGIGFIASGFDPAVFTTQVDTRYSTIVLGGVEVDEHESIPFISQLANLGEIDTSGVADPAAP